MNDKSLDWACFFRNLLCILLLIFFSLALYAAGNFFDFVPDIHDLTKYDLTGEYSPYFEPILEISKKAILLLGAGILSFFLIDSDKPIRWIFLFVPIFYILLFLSVNDDKIYLEDFFFKLLLIPVFIFFLICLGHYLAKVFIKLMGSLCRYTIGKRKINLRVSPYLIVIVLISLFFVHIYISIEFISSDYDSYFDYAPVGLSVLTVWFLVLVFVACLSFIKKRQIYLPYHLTIIIPGFLSILILGMVLANGWRIPMPDALNHAIGRNDVDIVSSLINGKNLNALNEQGETPLMIASKGSSSEIVELLLKSGAEVNFQNEQGETPLMIASKGNSTEIVELLLKSGAEVNSQNKQGETPLIIATKEWFTYEERSKDIVGLLLNYGADINVSSNSGTAFFKLSERLLSYKCDDDIPRIKWFLDKGVDIDIPNSDGKTPLMALVSNSCQNITRLLIEKEADLDAHDKNGKNALYSAVSEEKYDILELLLEKAVTVDLPRIEEADSAHASLLNRLCWHGSLLGYANKVRDACELAVKLDPNDSNKKDSRGLARALTGNKKGAIKDFEAYARWINIGKEKAKGKFLIYRTKINKAFEQALAVTPDNSENSWYSIKNKALDGDDKDYETFVYWINEERTRAQRESWIRDLRAGKNPFTLTLLNKLRD